MRRYEIRFSLKTTVPLHLCYQCPQASREELRRVAEKLDEYEGRGWANDETEKRKGLCNGLSVQSIPQDHLRNVSESEVAPGER